MSIGVVIATPTSHLLPIPLVRSPLSPLPRPFRCPPPPSGVCQKSFGRHRFACSSTAVFSLRGSDIRSGGAILSGACFSSSWPKFGALSCRPNRDCSLVRDSALEAGEAAGTDSEGEAAAESGQEVGRKRGAVGSGQRVKTSVVSTMADFLDLEKQFSFYGAYHSNRVNVFIHLLFVWPIFYTSLIPWAYTPALIPLPLVEGTLPLQQYMVLNVSFVVAALYGLYYIALDKKAGTIGALICLGCWIGAVAVAQTVPLSLAWKIVLASQVICWVSQIFGHQQFEGRAPALLDNLPQALLMAPFFVLLEALQMFGYEPYQGFHKKVQKNVDDAIRNFRESKGKKVA